MTTAIKSKTKSRARKQSNDPSRIWEFGIYEIDKECENLIKEQLWLSNQYYNKLIEIDKQSLDEYNNIQKKYNPGLVDAENLVISLKEKLANEKTDEELKRQEKALKKYNQNKKHNLVEIERCKAQILELKEKIKIEKTFEELKKAKDELKKIKKNFNYNEMFKSKKENILKEILKENEEKLKIILENNGKVFKDSFEDYNKNISPNDSFRKEIKQLLKDKMLNLPKETLNGVDISTYFIDMYKKEINKDEKEKKLKSDEEQFKHFKKLDFDTKFRLKSSKEQAKSNSKWGLKYKKFDFSGNISIQLIDNNSIKDLFENKCGKIKIHFDDISDNINDYGKYDYLSDNRWDTRKDRIPAPKKGRKGASAALSFSIGTDEERRMITCKTIIHRKIPDSIKVKGAAIKVYRVGPYIKYSLILNLEGNDFNNCILRNGDVKNRTTNNNIVALDVGWRKEENGLRVGCVGDSLNQELLIVPKRIIDDFEKSDSIRSIRDKMLDEVKVIFAELKSLTDPLLNESGKNIHSIRSPQKLIKLLKENRDISKTQPLWKEWRIECLANKTDLFKSKKETDQWFVFKNITDKVELCWLYLEWWYRQNRHLYQYESNLRDQALRYRKDLYRQWAKKWAKEGYKLTFEDFNKSEVSTETDRLNKTINRNRFYAATSELVDAFKNAFLKENCMKIDPENTSITCHICKHDISEDSAYEAGKEEYTCGECNNTWDRDKNAVCNMVTFPWECNL